MRQGVRAGETRAQPPRPCIAPSQTVGSVLPEARALKGRLESSTLGASLRPPWAARTPLIAPAVLYIAGGMRSELSRARRGGKGMERGRWGWCSGGCPGSVGEARAWERPLRVVYPASTAKECLFRRLPGRLEGPSSPRHEALLAGAKKDS